MRRSVEAALASFPDLPDWLDAALARANSFPGFAESIRALHSPRQAADVDPASPARRRLAYDELLAGQLSLGLVRQRLRKLPGQPVDATGAAAGADPRGPAVLPDARPAGGGRGHPCRHASQRTHVAPPAGRRRLGKDGRGDDGDGRRGGGRRAGRSHGADRDTCPAAPRHHLPHGRRRGHFRGNSHGPHEGAGTAGGARARRIRRGADRHRHARAVPGKRRLSQSSSRRRRRAASVRSPPAPSPDGQGHRARTCW